MSGPVALATVVLAAGGGTRFDGDRHKLVAQYRGRPLVWWAVAQAIAAGLGPVAVVTGAVDLGGLLPTGVTVLANEHWATGQASSLQVALTWARSLGVAAVVVGLGDQPLVPASAWRAVADASAPVATAVFDGRRCPPVRLDRSVWPLAPTSGDAGARTIMQRYPELVGEVPCAGDPLDVDTLADLADLLQRPEPAD